MENYDFEKLKEFLIIYMEFFGPSGHDYRGQLDEGLSSLPPADRKRSLKITLIDSLDLTSNANGERLEEFETYVKSKDLPSLTEVMSNYSDGLKKLLKKKRLKSFTQVYVVKNARDDGRLTEGEVLIADRLLESWEF